ncbi:unnamed protein product [Bursaphelenchus xylophilus]|uniref:(pine wood nematode) hypothetical protein n=1 Tax=Bursaphelenchus xylophilus TaxID=6326 RepID=A0A1I7RWU4_BURXY|nr:unnamed protein product [Bursaphelenchus xylophilus]CAG9128702.1 unnamed protein product [Bursaphelenchus xylophilus]
MAIVTDAAIQQFYASARRSHLYYEIGLAAVSLCLNGWVVYLVFTTKNRVMRSYSWVILMSMMGDLIYTGLNFITMMTVEVKGGKLVFLTMGLFEHYGYPYNLIMGCLWLAGMYTTILTLGMQFIYRYFALCRNGLTPWEFGSIYCVGLIICLCDGFVGFFIFDGISLEATKLLQEHPMYKEDTPGYAILDPTKPAALAHTFCSQLIIVFVYVVIYFTGKRISRKLNDAAGDMSSSTKDAQKQLNRVMILQAAYPGLIVALPIVIATVLAQFRFDVLWCGMYLAPSISLIPIANSVTILFFIPSFRRRILGGIQSRIQTKSVSKLGSTDASKGHTAEAGSGVSHAFEHVI